MEKLKYKNEDTYRGVVTNFLTSQQEFNKKSKIHYFYKKRVLPLEANLIRDIVLTTTENKNNSFDINTILFYTYIFLYSNGYLSLNNKFQTEKDPSEIPMEMGISINTGKGVCRNIATHYTELLNILCPNQINLLIQTSENHLETLVINKSGIFLYDPTNLKIKKISNIGKSKDMHYFNLWYNLFRGDFLNNEEKRLEFFNKSKEIRYILEHSDRIPINEKYLNGLKRYSIDLCAINYDKIKEFQEEISPTYKYINKSKNNYFKTLGIKNKL